jgi:hypothetical protein
MFCTFAELAEGDRRAKELGVLNDQGFRHPSWAEMTGRNVDSADAVSHHEKRLNAIAR